MAKKVKNGNQTTELSSASLIEHIKVVGFGKGSFGERFVKLRIKEGKHRRSVLVRIDDLHEHNTGPVITRLNQKGAHLLSKKAKEQFMQLLQNTKPSGDEFAVATRPGRHRAHFVLPDMVISAVQPPLKKCLDGLPADVLGKFRFGGGLDGWKEAAQYAKGNSRFILGLGVAFSGIVASISGNETIAIQYSGPAGTGKTALAAIISSVWGRKQDPSAEKYGAVETWLHTLNNLDVILAAHNNTLLGLDETRNTGVGKFARPVLDAAMRIEGGIAKGRLTESGPRRNWQVPVISTSNLSMLDLLHATNQEIDGAYLDRLIDIPMPEGGIGIFETLHGHDSLPAFVQQLKKITSAHFGLVGRMFVEDLLGLHGHARKELLEWIEERRQGYIRKARKSAVAAGRDLNRIHGRFATVYAACCLAAEFGFLGLKRGEILAAMLKCEQGHVSYAARRSVELSKKTPLHAIKGYLCANGGQMIDLRQKQVSQIGAIKPPGYLAKKAGDDYLLISEHDLSTAVGGTAAASKLKHDLQLTGDIARTGAGGGTTRFSAKWPIPQADGTTVRRPMIAIRMSALQ
jgi:putative DNA primase/helicase